MSDNKFFSVFDQEFGVFLKEVMKDTILYYKKESSYQAFVMIKDPMNKSTILLRGFECDTDAHKNLQHGLIKYYCRKLLNKHIKLQLLGGAKWRIMDNTLFLFGESHWFGKIKKPEIIEQYTDLLKEKLGVERVSIDISR